MDIPVNIVKYKVDIREQDLKNGSDGSWTFQ